MDKEVYNDPEISNAELVNRDTFERLMAKKKHKKIFRRINYVLISVVLCFVFVIVCMALFLKIETIKVSGNERYTKKEIVQVSGIKEGQNLYAINKKAAKALIMEEFPYITEVVIRRTLPSTLTFKVTEETPAYFTEMAGEYYILSANLRVLERTEERPVATEEQRLVMLLLSDVKSIIVGQNVEFTKDLAFDYISEFIKELTEHEVTDKLTEIDISSKYNIYVTYEDRFRVYLGDNTETDMKLTFAELMIKEFEPTQRGSVDAHDITMGSVILDN